MILLEYNNRVIRDTLTERFNAEKPETVDITVADFDGVKFHLSTDPQNKSLLLVSISMGCFSELQQHGVEDLLKREYGNFVSSSVEPGFDFTLAIDQDKLPQDKAALVEKISLFKRNCIAAPFEKFFNLQETGGSGSNKFAAIHYREDETMYINAEKDRVTVIFSILFRDTDDMIIGKVFLSEFVDARKKLQQAPQVIFSDKEPPRELEGTGAKAGDNLSYVTFVLFPRHLKGDVRNNTINLVQTFRDYLHYHIKCSKAYLHSRMRARVAALLKVLNRAKPELPTVEKKTASGKTFQRKV